MNYMNHPIISNSISELVMSPDKTARFHGEFLLFVKFVPSNKGTCSASFDCRTMIYTYNEEWLLSLTRKEQLFVHCHEVHHFIRAHLLRFVQGMNLKISNIAMDMLINTWLLDLYCQWMKIPECGKLNVVPKEYFGLMLWEPLYYWLMEQKVLYDNWKKEQEDDNDEQDDGDGQGDNSDNNSDGQNESNKNSSSTKPCPVSQQLYDIFENPETIDQHIENSLTPEQAKHVLEEPLRILEARGLIPNEIERELKRINKQRKDYIKDIKRTISSMKGGLKTKSFMRPNRKGIEGLKGKRRKGPMINVLLDTSGSMFGEFEKVLSYIFQNDIEINLVQCDTKVHCTEKLKSLKDISNIKIKGCGGTILQPGVNHIKENLPQCGTVVLTDGWCDALNFSGFKKKVLVITCGANPRITKGMEKVKFVNIKQQ